MNKTYLLTVLYSEKVSDNCLIFILNMLFAVLAFSCTEYIPCYTSLLRTRWPLHAERDEGVSADKEWLGVY